MNEIQQYLSLLILCSLIWFAGWLVHWSMQTINAPKYGVANYIISLLLKPGLGTVSTNIRGTLLQIVAITTMVGALVAGYGFHIENPVLFAYKYLLGIGLIIAVIALFLIQFFQRKA